MALPPFRAMRAWIMFAGVSCAAALLAQEAVPPSSSSLRVERVRHWVMGDTVRVSIDVSSDFQFRRGRLSNPERLYFDIVGAKPPESGVKVQTIAVGERLLKQIRVSETQPSVTRVVLDLERPVDYSAAQLANPDRLVIELKPEAAKSSTRPKKAGAGTEEKPADTGRASATPASKADPSVPAVTVPEPKPAASQPPSVPASKSVPAVVNEHAVTRDPTPAAAESKLAAAPSLPADPALRAVPPPSEVNHAADSSVAPPPSKGTPAASVPVSSAKPATTAPAQSATASEPPMVPLPASKSRAGRNSLVRALGLKLERVVIDPGHGGHDTGTIGPNGLLEKDLVLDVARRLGALIEDRLGAEVIYTRTEDVFVPLEERTALANEKRADLFLSIHGNAGVRSATGTETYYLNFTTSKNAMEVAARENASSQRSIHELQSLIEKIALKDKVDESREFAARVQSSLVKELARTNSASRDRGVRKAPFVVLIGASMPSVLSEIAFLSNSREEKLLGRPDYRQKIAEGLYKGVSQYASTLSRFQLAEKKKP